MVLYAEDKENEELIEEIKAGIIKEVSVGCAVKSCICSVCGKELGKSECSHVRGGIYDGRLCYGELQNPTDAYEWSFVAVPAQKNAGITKIRFHRRRRRKSATDVLEK